MPSRGSVVYAAHNSAVALDAGHSESQNPLRAYTSGTSLRTAIERVGYRLRPPELRRKLNCKFFV